MPSKGSKFTPKQDRMAQHIADSERGQGESAEDAQRTGYSTVNARKSKPIKTGGKK